MIVRDQRWICHPELGERLRESVDVFGARSFEVRAMGVCFDRDTGRGLGLSME